MFWRIVFWRIVFWRIVFWRIVFWRFVLLVLEVVFDVLEVLIAWVACRSVYWKP